MSEPLQNITLSPREKLKMFFISLAIGARLNPLNMQGLAVSAALREPLKKIIPQKEERCDVLYRHLAHFNTHPYFASMMLGAIFDYEKKRLTGSMSEKRITLLRDGLANPLAAIGDQFFWGSLKPFSIIIALPFLLSPAPWLAPFILLLAYNAVHIPMRVQGFLEALKDGENFLGVIAKYHLPSLSLRLKQITVVMLGLLLCYWFAQHAKPYLTEEAIIASASGIALFSVAMKWGNTKPVLLFFLIALIFAFIGIG